MGQATIMGNVDPQPKHHVLPLHGRGRDSEETMPGTVSVVITSSEDLTAFQRVGIQDSRQIGLSFVSFGVMSKQASLTC